MARKVVNGVIERAFYDEPAKPWLLLTARECRALNGKRGHDTGKEATRP